MFTITDTTTDTQVTVEYAEDVAAAILPWYPEAPAEVTDAINELQDALLRGAYTGDLETYLAVTVD